jgi:hypothetical protein
MQLDVELVHSRDEVLAVLGLIRSHGDAPLKTFSLIVEYQQRSLAFGGAACRGGHRGGDQAVAVLHQRVAQLVQMRLLAIQPASRAALCGLILLLRSQVKRRSRDSMLTSHVSRVHPA